jgi:hypothetical protein
MEEKARILADEQWRKERVQQRVPQDNGIVEAPTEQIAAPALEPINAEEPVAPIAEAPIPEEEPVGQALEPAPEELAPQISDSELAAEPGVAESPLVNKGNFDVEEHAANAISGTEDAASQETTKEDGFDSFVNQIISNDEKTLADRRGEIVAPAPRRGGTETQISNQVKAKLGGDIEISDKSIHPDVPDGPAAIVFNGAIRQVSPYNSLVYAGYPATKETRKLASKMDNDFGKLAREYKKNAKLNPDLAGLGLDPQMAAKIQASKENVQARSATVVPAQPIIYSYNGEPIQVTPEQKAKLDELDSKPAKDRGSAMRIAAEKRQIIGNLTKNELSAQNKKLASNYIGKPVEVNGKPGKIVSNPFGKVSVVFDDGTKVTVNPEHIKPIVTAPKFNRLAKDRNYVPGETAPPSKYEDDVADHYNGTDPEKEAPEKYTKGLSKTTRIRGTKYSVYNPEEEVADFVVSGLSRLSNLANSIGEIARKISVVANIRSGAEYKGLSPTGSFLGVGRGRRMNSLMSGGTRRRANY